MVPIFLGAKAADVKQATISCHFHGYNGSAVFLYRVENGQATSMGFKRPDANSNCSFVFDVQQEGVYLLRKAGAHQFTFANPVYLKAGDKKDVEIYSSQGIDFDSVKISNANKETVCLKDWADAFNKTFGKGNNRNNKEAFFEAYDQLVKKAAQIKKDGLTANKYFNKLFIAKIESELVLLKAGSFFNFGERMNSAYDSAANHKQFYASLNNLKLDNKDILQSEYGITTMDYVLGYQLFHQYGNAQQMLATPFLDKINRVNNDALRAAYAAQHMEGIKTYEKFVSEIEPFKQIMFSGGFQKAYEQKDKELSHFTKGQPGYNFSYYDTNDKLRTLADFKGKVVVLDMWAMWCASCLAEKPNFTKLEEEFKSRGDVVFVGISCDGAAKKKPWKQFVARKGYTSIELLQEPNDEMAKYYDISGIPRFMIFDKEGKIVTVDAPRPSNPALKELIEETLKKSDNAVNH
jgi:thiol-disulfide isomerase/thioredoxin